MGERCMSILVLLFTPSLPAYRNLAKPASCYSRKSRTCHSCGKYSRTSIVMTSPLQPTAIVTDNPLWRLVTMLESVKRARSSSTLPASLDHFSSKVFTLLLFLVCPFDPRCTHRCAEV